jgi:serine/threonine protein kinase
MAEAKKGAGASKTEAAEPSKAALIPKYFALKIMKKLEVVRLKQVEHIRNEKNILMSINHPFLVTLFAVAQDKRNLYMVLEFIIGGELFTHLRKAGKFTNEHGRFYAAQVSMGLQYLHEECGKGCIVYRDLKPENILIDRVGYLKITDFGFAKRIEDRTWTLCGTPEYLAPEIIQSKGHGKAVDWWAIGVLIYEMLAGYPPFYDENPFGIYQLILAGKIEFPRYVETHARDLIRKLLTSDRAKRLGNLKAGGDDVRKHKWYRGLSFDSVFMKEVEAPFVPEISGDGDTQQFDEYPDSEDDGGPEPLSKDVDDDLFGSF